jgi:hypothetical protein
VQFLYGATTAPALAEKVAPRKTALRTEVSLRDIRNNVSQIRLEEHHLSITSMLYRLARASATGRAARKGPAAFGKRIVRKQVGRAVARSGIFRWPR